MDDVSRWAGAVSLFLLLCGVVGATAQLEAGGSWSNFKNKEQGTSLYNHASGSFLTSGLTQSSVPVGSNFQFLSADLDGDGNVEVIGTADDAVVVLNRVGGVLVLKSSSFVGAVQNGQASLFNDSGTIVYVLPAGDFIMGLVWNGSQMYIREKLNTTKFRGHQTGVVCSDSSGVATLVPGCYYGTNNTIEQYRPSTNSTTNLTRITQTPNGGFLVLDDWDLDNHLEAGYWHHNTGGTFYDNVTVYDLFSKTQQLNKRFALSTGIQNTVTDIAFANRLGSLKDDLFVLGYATACGGCAGDYAQIVAYDTAGATVTYNVANSACDPCSTTTGSMAFGSFTNTSARQVCATGTQSSPGRTISRLVCRDLGSTKSHYNVTTNNSRLLYPGNTWKIVAFDANGDGYTDLFTSQQIVFPHDAAFLNVSPGVDVLPIVADLEGFGQPGYFGAASGLAVLAVSGVGGVSGQTITQTGRQLDWSPGSPVCAGSTVTFVAKNCVSWPAAECSYTLNSSTKAAYLWSTCGTGSSLGPFVSGLPGYSGVALSCFFNSTGQFSFDVHIALNGNSPDPLNDKRWPVVVGVVNESDTLCNQAAYTGQYGVVPIEGVSCVGGVCSQAPSVSGQVCPYSAIVCAFTGDGSIPPFVVGVLAILIFTFLTVATLAGYGIREAQIFVGIAGIVDFFVAMALIVYGFFSAWILLVFILAAAAFVSLRFWREHGPQMHG